MGPDASAPSGDDLARLDELLSAPPHGASSLALDELHGFCVALAMGPDAEAPDDWITIVLDSDAAPSAELANLLERFRDTAAQALNDGTLEIRGRVTRTGRIDRASWCRGFIAGSNASTSDWYEYGDAEDFDELMFPIEVLADALPDDVRASYGPAQWRQLARDAEDDLVPAVLRLRDYWRIVRTPPATIRREEPKVGRNDPCPCGSGRKFKQCHGRG
jgi:uncharacterized protein